jgi:hypothetical protein
MTLTLTHVVAASILTILLAGCATQTTPITEPSPATEIDSSAAESDSSTGVQVDQGLLNVDVTVPKSFFEGQTETEIVANAEEAGYSKYVLNDDGSVTYTMSKARYDAGLKEIRDGIDQAIQEAVDASPEVFSSITYDKSMTNFDVKVDRAAYEGNFETAFIGFTLGFSGMFYQVFDGVPSDEQEVLINFIDSSTNEVFDTQTWPAKD